MGEDPPPHAVSRVAVIRAIVKGRERRVERMGINTLKYLKI